MAVDALQAKMDISKLKVPDLKRELKNRGLSTTGNKNDLIERLQSALKARVDDTVSAGSIDDLDEDLLNDDDDEHLDTSESVIQDFDSALDNALMSQKSQKRKSEDNSNENKSVPKKIVLNRNASVTSETSQNGSVDISLEKKSPDTEKKVIKLSELSVKERLEMRAKKFGVQLSADAKKAARSERFGVSSGASTTTNSASLDVLQKRAERFGTSVSPALSQLEQQEKLEKRKQRFGIDPTPANGVAQSEKAKQRLERFKQPVK